MFPTVTMVAALLFVVALWVLLDACRPASLSQLGAFSRQPGGHEAADEHREQQSMFFALSQEDRDCFVQLWHSVRQEFESNPRITVLHADLLISDLLEDCHGGVSTEPGAPATPPSLLKNAYRNAHEIAMRSRMGSAERRELDRAMHLYDLLFRELLDSETIAASERHPAGRIR